MPSSCHIGLTDITEIDIECEHTKTTLHARGVNKIFDVLEK